MKTAQTAQTAPTRTSPSLASDKTDLFETGSPVTQSSSETSDAAKTLVPDGYNIGTVGPAKVLQGEAEEMELALRDEARAKGLPDAAFDKLVPLRGAIKPNPKTDEK